MVLQVPGHLRRQRSGTADEHQQHLDDDTRLERSGQVGRAAGSERAIAGEMHVAERKQAEAVEAGGVAVGVEAAVVVVAAQVADLAEVAEGGGPGSPAEGVPELIETVTGKLEASKSGERRV